MSTQRLEKVAIALGMLGALVGLAAIALDLTFGLRLVSDRFVGVLFCVEAFAVLLLFVATAIDEFRSF